VEHFVADLNHALFLALNAGADAPGFLVAFAILAAKYLTLFLPLALAAVWVRGDRTRRFVALSCLVALLISLAANQVVGLLAYSPRPFVLGLGRTLIEHRPSSSFPSNHGTIWFTAAAVLIVFEHRRLAVATAALGLLVAWSRIYLGIHYPLDMLGALGSAALAAPLAAWAMTHWGGSWLAAAEGVYRRLFGPLIRLGLVRS
jgi:undecaprenyl-diphosphatase